MRGRLREALVKDVLGDAIEKTFDFSAGDHSASHATDHVRK
jgi:hypothetical protein